MKRFFSGVPRKPRQLLSTNRKSRKTGAGQTHNAPGLKVHVSESGVLNVSSSS